jgi:hypothetical protein
MPDVLGRSKAHERSATFWFVKFDLALEDGDWTAAHTAATELLRLGIDIRLRLDRGRLQSSEAQGV